MKIYYVVFCLLIASKASAQNWERSRIDNLNRKLDSTVQSHNIRSDRKLSSMTEAEKKECGIAMGYWFVDNKYRLRMVNECLRNRQYTGRMISWMMMKGFDFINE